MFFFFFFLKLTPYPALLPLPSPFGFIGTNAYWLPFLNSDEDISNTLADLKANGITVVRTWAFNGANRPFHD